MVSKYSSVYYSIVRVLLIMGWWLVYYKYSIVYKMYSRS